MSAFVFALVALATYRSALMLSSEEGPAALFAKMRRKVPAKTNPGRGIRCIYCWSVWIAGATTGYLLYLGDVPLAMSPFYWLATSGGAIALHQTFTKA